MLKRQKKKQKWLKSTDRDNHQSTQGGSRREWKKHSGCETGSKQFQRGNSQSLPVRTYLDSKEIKLCDKKDMECVGLICIVVIKTVTESNLGREG